MRTISAILLTLLLVGSTVVGQAPPGPPPLPKDSIQAVTSADGPAGSGKVKADISGISIQVGASYSSQFYKWDVQKQNWVKSGAGGGPVTTGSFAYVDQDIVASNQLVNCTANLYRNGNVIASDPTGNTIGAPWLHSNP